MRGAAPVERQRHQQRGEELARHVAAHAHASCSALIAAGADARAAGSPRAEVVDVARRARAAHRPGRRSAARACAARPRARSRRRHSASAAVSGRNAVPALPRNSSARLTRNDAASAVHPQVPSPPRPRRARRARAAPRACTRVSSESSRPRDLRVARRERGQQQHAVRDALRSGQRAPCRRPGAAGGSRGASHADSARPSRRGGVASAPSARRAAARSISALERLGVAVLEQLRERGELRLIARPARRAARRGWRSQMSRHISGRLAAMRVKSRKPPAAKAKSSRRVGARGDLAHEREREQVRQVAHRGEHRVVVLGASCGHARAARLPRRPHALDRLADRFRRRRQHHCGRDRARRCAAAAPLSSRPAIGCAGTNRGKLSRSAGARRRDHVALGAAGVGHHGARLERGATRRRAPRWADRRGHQHEVGAAPRVHASSRSRVDRCPAPRATLRFARLRPTPTTWRPRRPPSARGRTNRRSGPTPMTASVPMLRSARHACAARARQRRARASAEEACVLLRQCRR